MSIARAEQLIAVWREDARRRGAFPTVFPAGGPDAGDLAERTIVAGAAQYIPAPPAVEALHQAIMAQEREDIAWGVRLQWLEDAIAGAGDWLASLPRELVAKVLGVPPWTVTVLALGAALFVARAFLPRGGR